MPTPVLHVLAGPNGAGKSTFADRILLPVTHLPFVNADLIAAAKWPDDTAAHAYEASRIAAAMRLQLMASRTSFVTETVFSHPSKLQGIHQASSLGYLVYLHLVAVPMELSLARVAERVRRGGHEVPEAKVRERYERLWPLTVEAARTADRATVYDNSRAERPYRIIASLERGRLLAEPDWPMWTPQPLRSLVAE